MLDDRKTAILRAVVEGYIHSTQPVGSAAVARQAGIDFSPATVRNEMAVLEQEGYLTAPHTSAGRVPTDKGYRHFVDALGAQPVVAPVEIHRVAEFFNETHGQLEQLLQDTSVLLSDLTRSAAVVVDDSVDAAVVRSVQLVALSSQTMLVVVVMSTGAVEKVSVELGAEIEAAVLPSAGAILDASLQGRHLGDVGECPAVPGDETLGFVVGLAHAGLAALAAEVDARLFMDGTSRMAEAFDAVETVRSVLTILERQMVVVTMVKDVLDRGRRVAIGSENSDERLAECSLVVAPFEVGGERAGTIGVLGPTRMDYSQALDAVAVVSRRLGEHLTER